MILKQVNNWVIPPAGYDFKGMMPTGGSFLLVYTKDTARHHYTKSIYCESNGRPVFETTDILPQVSVNAPEPKKLSFFERVWLYVQIYVLGRA